MIVTPHVSILLLAMICLLTGSGASAITKTINASPAIQAFESWLALPAALRPPLEKQAFASTPLTRTEASLACHRLWDDYARAVRPALRADWDNKAVQVGDVKMKFDYRVFGQKPEKGWDLYVSFHGGGGAPAAVNESQWINQINLYTPKQGIYLAPRAPTDSWDMWHKAHIDALLARLIEGAVLIKGVNPDRIYIMGYSAGGDGVYQVAARMADRLAAASAMAGHPNETSPLGLRNIAFTVHVGENDGAYRRNKVAADWKKKLDDLQATDPAGYVHEVILHKGLGHWMNREDAVALGWMAAFTRNPLPDKVVWKQDDVTHSQFYWLALPEEAVKARSEITAERTGQTLVLTKVSDVSKVTLLLNDRMLDLDKPVSVLWNGKTLFSGMVPRTLATLSRTLNEKRDAELCFPSGVTVELKDETQATGSREDIVK